VEGKVFHRGAVMALAPEADRAGVGSQLLSLMRKELVRPDRTQIAGDDAFRFRHLLIRDTAYDSLPKAVRAELHERFGDWLAAHGDLLEQDELVGYHLEQAAGYLRELDVDDPRAAAIASRAAECLAAAGHTAFERRETSTARGLLQRAHALLPSGAERRRLVPELIEVLNHLGAAADTPPLLEELDNGDELDQARASVARVIIDPLGEGRSPEESNRLLDHAEPILERNADVVGLGRLEVARAWMAWLVCRGDESLAAYRRAWDRFEAGGVVGYRAELIQRIAAGMAFAGVPVADERQEIQKLATPLLPTAGPMFEAALAANLATNSYLTRDMDFAELLRVHEHLTDLLEQTGSPRRAMAAFGFVVGAARVEGNYELEERLLREHVTFLRKIGNEAALTNQVAAWARSLVSLGRANEALQLVADARPASRADDVADQVLLDSVEGSALAALGDPRALECFARAWERAAGVVMAPMTFDLGADEAIARLQLGDLDGARTVAESIVSDVERQGALRLGDYIRREVLDRIDAEGPAAKRTGLVRRDKR
jgi:hypothetical protein